MAFPPLRLKSKRRAIHGPCKLFGVVWPASAEPNVRFCGNDGCAPFRLAAKTPPCPHRNCRNSLLLKRASDSSFTSFLFRRCCQSSFPHLFRFSFPCSFHLRDLPRRVFTTRSLPNTSHFSLLPPPHTMATPDWIQVGIPSLDNPFGVKLWPIFGKAWESVVGYPPEKFHFVQGETPLSTFKTCTITLITYYIVIFGGRELMRDRPAFKLNFLFKVHNFYLTAISGILLALFAEQLIPTVARKGLFFAICDHKGGWTDKLVVLYYVGFHRAVSCPPALLIAF